MFLVEIAGRGWVIKASALELSPHGSVIPVTGFGEPLGFGLDSLGALVMVGGSLLLDVPIKGCPAIVRSRRSWFS